MTTKPVVFILLASISISCAKKQREPSLDVQCNNDIKSASKLLGSAKELEKVTKGSITKLIQAAKIHQEHARFPSCIDKAQRALTLIKNQPKSN